MEAYPLNTSVKKLGQSKIISITRDILPTTLNEKIDNADIGYPNQFGSDSITTIGIIGIIATSWTIAGWNCGLSPIDSFRDFFRNFDITHAMVGYLFGAPLIRILVIVLKSCILKQILKHSNFELIPCFVSGRRSPLNHIYNIEFNFGNTSKKVMVSQYLYSALYYSQYCFLMKRGDMVCGCIPLQPCDIDMEHSLNYNDVYYQVWDNLKNKNRVG